MVGARRHAVEGAGVELAVSECGEGPTILLVHGMGTGAWAWEPLLDALAADDAPRARAIAYDRRGYGSSGAPEPYARTTVAEQGEDAAAVLRRLGAAPAIVCGVDLGALVALDLLRRHGVLARGAVLVVPPLYAFVPAATQALAEERAAIEQGLRDRGADGAIDAWLERAGRVAAVRRHPRGPGELHAFFADYGAQASWPVTRGELRAIAAPVVVLEGAAPAPHVRAAAAALVELLPAGRLVAGDDPLPALRELLDR